MAVTDDTVDPIMRWGREVAAIYDLVLVSPSLAFREAGFLPLATQAAERIQRDTGITAFGYQHITDTHSIRHILKNHGTDKEYLRGQVPLVREDFLMLPEVFSSPDFIENGGKTKPGRDTVRYRKIIGEFCYYYTEEVRTKKNRLAAVTFYKRKI